MTKTCFLGIAALPLCCHMGNTDNTPPARKRNQGPTLRGSMPSSNLDTRLAKASRVCYRTVITCVQEQGKPAPATGRRFRFHSKYPQLSLRRCAFVGRPENTDVCPCALKVVFVAHACYIIVQARLAPNGPVYPPNTPPLAFFDLPSILTRQKPRIKQPPPHRRRHLATARTEQHRTLKAASDRPFYLSLT